MPQVLCHAYLHKDPVNRRHDCRPGRRPGVYKRPRANHTPTARRRRLFTPALCKTAGETCRALTARRVPPGLMVAGEARESIRRKCKTDTEKCQGTTHLRRGRRRCRRSSDHVKEVLGRLDAGSVVPAPSTSGARGPARSSRLAPRPRRTTTERRQRETTTQQFLPGAGAPTPAHHRQSATRRRIACRPGFGTQTPTRLPARGSRFSRLAEPALPADCRRPSCVTSSQWNSRGPEQTSR